MSGHELSMARLINSKKYLNAFKEYKENKDQSIKKMNRWNNWHWCQDRKRRGKTDCCEQWWVKNPGASSEITWEGSVTVCGRLFHACVCVTLWDSVELFAVWFISQASGPCLCVCESVWSHYEMQIRRSSECYYSAVEEHHEAIYGKDKQFIRPMFCHMCPLLVKKKKQLIGLLAGVRAWLLKVKLKCIKLKPWCSFFLTSFYLCIQVVYAVFLPRR